MAKKCEKDEMIAYGLIGDSKTLDSKSSFCPNIERNCCGEFDHFNIEKYYYWDSKWE